MKCLRDTQKRECLHTMSQGIEDNTAHNLEEFHGLMIAHLGTKIPAEVLGLPMKETLLFPTYLGVCSMLLCSHAVAASNEGLCLDKILLCSRISYFFK